MVNPYPKGTKPAEPEPLVQDDHKDWLDLKFICRVLERCKQGSPPPESDIALAHSNAMRLRKNLWQKLSDET